MVRRAVRSPPWPLGWALATGDFTMAYVAAVPTEPRRGPTGWPACGAAWAARCCSGRRSWPRGAGGGGVHGIERAPARWLRAAFPPSTAWFATPSAELRRGRRPRRHADPAPPGDALPPADPLPRPHQPGRPGRVMARRVLDGPPDPRGRPVRRQLLAVLACSPSGWWPAPTGPTWSSDGVASGRGTVENTALLPWLAVPWLPRQGLGGGARGCAGRRVHRPRRAVRAPPWPSPCGARSHPLRVRPPSVPPSARTPPWLAWRSSRARRRRGAGGHVAAAQRAP